MASEDSVAPKGGNMFGLYEGDFIFVRSITATYGPNSRVQYKAPKGKVIVLVAVECAEGTDRAGDVQKRIKEKIAQWPRPSADDYPDTGALLGSVVAPMRM